jgi:hypothetical protein
MLAMICWATFAGSVPQTLWAPKNIGRSRPGSHTAQNPRSGRAGSAIGVQNSMGIGDWGLEEHV